MSITADERNNSRADIECPGDTISYNCSIMTNSPDPELIWTVSVPGDVPRTIIYNSSNSAMTDRFIMDLGISSTLISMSMTDVLNYVVTYIDANIEFTVQNGVTLRESMLQCGIRDLNDDTILVSVNISGNNYFSTINNMNVCNMMP